ncbi:DNA polymerase I [Angustibacter luteus]|uniref:DNA polymerase I n=1 Tax=Angustibacter luteus TaxID=658456 RepID=A0ABW1JB51_9ACTN
MLLDGHSLAYRAFFALPPENFSTSTGQTTNAVYGFTSMLINLLRDEQPTHIAVAFDVSRQTFRSEEYAEYKAGRSKTPDEFKGQISLLHEVLAALRIPVIEKEGFEADDVIATLTTQAAAQGLDVLICSGDRDNFQLVSDRTTVLYPVRGVSELWRMDPQAVLDKYGVPPERYPDLAALVGETSDNLPGVPGVGPKTAAKWITTYGDLHGVVANVDLIKGKAGESLREHLDGVLRNRRLNALVRDLELPLGPADLARQQWDRDEVHQVFDGLEFRVLRERLFATVDAAAPEAESGFDLATSKLDSTAVADWLTEHAGAGVRTGLHVVGSWGRGAGDARGLAVAAADESAGYVDLESLDEAGLAAVGDWLGDPARPKALHDAKGPGHALRERGLPLRGVVSDTALAAYLVKPDQRSYDLADLVLRHLSRELRLEAEDPSGQLTLDTGEGPDEDETAMVQARAVLDLADALDAELEARGGAELLRDVELPLVRVLAEMERIGIGVDDDQLADLEAGFAGEVKRAADEAFAALPQAADGSARTLNLGSPKQLQTVLFDELGMPKTKRTKTGYTTDAEALQDLYVKSPHPFLEALLRHRDVSRLRQTVEGLRKTVSDDGRIHTTYNQTIAATGRLSSTDPNLQNIPIRTDEGRRIREAFVVGPGFESLMTADYSQIEMRIMAHLSGDAGLIEAFNTGEDLHRFVGARVFGVEPVDVTSAMRSKVKAMSYGLAYGLSAFGLSRQLRIDVDEARGLMGEYFERFGGVRVYLDSVVDEARRTGYTQTMLGRRRYLPDLTSDNRQRREAAERMALNAPIQGSAADIIKVAMLRVAAALEQQDLRSRMLLQVHDELIFDVAPGERDDLEALVRQAMGHAIELSVPLDVSVGVGQSWESAGH